MRFPIPTEVPGPSSMRGGGIPVPDQSGEQIAQGVSALASGVRSAAGSIADVAVRQMDQQNTIDLSRAETARTAAYLDIQNAVSRDPNYGDYSATYQPRLDEAVQKAAGLIRDPRMRERWLADQEVGKLKMVDAWTQRGIGLRDEQNQVALSASAEDNFRLMSDPTVPLEVRNKARADLTGSLHMAVSTGLITPGKATELQGKYLKGADQALAANLAELDIMADPQTVMTGMAIPTEGANGSVLDAQMAVDNGVLALDPELAAGTAHLLGDANFPEGDPKAIAAYLSDPQKRLDYAEAAVAHLSDRYKGDLSAVVIAMDPNGGTAAADRWVQSNHSPGSIPPKVEARYQEVMSRMMAAQPINRRTPITTDGVVDIGQIDVGVLKQFENLQSHLGVSLPVTQGDKSSLPVTPSITVNVGMLGEDARAKLVEMASAYGFTGIGIGKDTMTFDTGKLRAWGPDGTPSSVPSWAKDAVTTHESGDVKPLPMLYSGVAPEYAALSFDQRMTLYAKAKAALADRNVSTRSSLETIAANAPAAISSTGKYDGDMPTATQFVQAWGAEEGIQRWNEFQASVDVAKQSYGFLGATNTEIMNALHAATPMSSGNNAALEQKRFDVINKAAQAVLKAREDDPAGYVLQNMPAVSAAFEAAQKDKTQFPLALKTMANAQTELGIANPQPLPKGMVTAAVAAWKDETKPPAERIGAVAGIVFATSDLQQQDAIFSQLLEAGAPTMLAGPLQAMRRNDIDGANALMRAVMVDPDKLGSKLEVKDDAIKQEIADTVFDAGGIGTISYGLHAATAENLQAVGAANDLLYRDAKLRLLDGTAHDAPSAVAAAARDMFGDDQVITSSAGGGFTLPVGIGAITLGGQQGTAQIAVTAPKAVDPEQLKRGFGNLAPMVRSATRAFMIGNGLGAAPGESNAPLIMSVDNYVDTAMTDGYFTDAGGFLPAGQKGYVFFYNDGPIPRPDGQGPLIFTLDDVLAASNGRNFTGPPDNRLGYR